MSDNPTNKVKYNLKNVHIAKLTISGDTYTYGTPKAMPGAVSMSLDAEGDNTPFYADGIVYFRPNTNNGYSGDLEMALIPDWFREDILQEEMDTNKVLFESANVTEAQHFALLFEFDGDQHQVRHCLFNCTVARPSIASQTKEASITPVTETLTITADPGADGYVKSKTTAETDTTAYDGWYSTVYTNGGSSETDTE